jgi:hypothetical protein
MVKKMDKENIIMLMEIFMMDYGWMIKKKVEVDILTILPGKCKSNFTIEYDLLYLNFHVNVLSKSYDG